MPVLPRHTRRFLPIVAYILRARAAYRRARLARARREARAKRKQT